MTPQELKTLILADATATSFFNAGNDGECAAHMVANYTERRTYQATKLQLYVSFGFARGLEIMETLRYYGSDSSPAPSQKIAFKEIVDLLESQNASRAPDLGLPETDSMLAGWVTLGIITSGERSTLINLGKQPLSVTAQDVEFARTRI